MTLRDIKRKKVQDAYKAFLAASDEWMEFIKANPETIDVSQAAMDLVQRAVCAHYKIPLTSMSSKRKTSEITLPRQIAMAICRDVAKRTFQQIGNAFGGRDHGTAIFACESIANRMSTDARFKADYLSLRKQCENLVDNIDTPLFATNGQ